MAAYDIMPFSSPGGNPGRRAFPVTASQTFQAGEPVVLTAAGTLSECADDPSALDGIAAHRSTDVDGTDQGVGFQVTTYAPLRNQIFRCNNFATDGAGTAVAPTLTDIGTLGGLTFLNSLDWVVDMGTANMILCIVGVQDSNGRDLSDPNLLVGAGVTALFTFVSPVG